MMIQALPHFPASGGGSGGAEITFVGGKSSAYESGGSPSTISLTNLTGGSDAAPAANDIVVVAVGNIEASDQNLSVTGYTEHWDVFKTDSIELNFGVYSKVMGGTPDTSLTVSASAISTTVRILVFRGVDTSTPMDVAVVTNSAIDSGNAVIPAITPVTTGAMVVGMAASVAGNVLNVPSTMLNPGSYSPFLSSKQGKIVSCIGAKEWDGSGAEGPFTMGGASGSTACWAALAMALRPA